ncbi:Nn.00g056980.m01.CDS01 [Neocucurbitaria sp. VM-36]
MIDEVLVHISTPATKQNDTLYQSLSKAYLQFEPQKNYTSESQREQHGLTEPTSSRPDPNPQPKNASLSHAATDSSVYSTSKDSYGSFPSHISFDVIAKDYNVNDTQPQHGSLEDGSVPTSSRLAQLERLHKNWKEQITSKPRFKDGTRRLRRTPGNSEDADTAFIEDTQVAVQDLQSQLQDTYSTTSEDTSDDDAEPDDKSQYDRLPVVDDSQQDVGRSKVEVLISASSTANAESGFINANQEKSRFNDTLESLIPGSQGGLNSHKRMDVHRASLDSMDFSKLPVNAFPPAPQLSVAKPGRLPSQITKYLAAIKTQNPKRFKPSKKLRIPKSDDRGYWSLDCSNWPNKSQHEFWSSMCEHILSGRLGWGSTLHREPSAQLLGQVKLYCWGEVVEHMWLVLWLCSKGRTSGSRSTWHDADGIAVFQVP